MEHDADCCSRCWHWCRKIAPAGSKVSVVAVVCDENVDDGNNDVIILNHC